MQPIEKSYCVQIVSRENGEVSWTSEEMSYRRAEKVESGAMINLDHKRFYTRIEEANKIKSEA